jgi:putative oxidoreductase
MSLIDRIVKQNEAVLLLLGRLLLAALFIPGGLYKLLDLGRFTGALAARGVPLATAIAPVAAAAEFFGGLIILLGFRTRWAACLMICFTIIASLISHRYWELTDAAARTAQSINFWKNAAIIGGFLLLLVRGPGRLSVDRTD